MGSYNRINIKKRKKIKSVFEVIRGWLIVSLMLFAHKLISSIKPAYILYRYSQRNTIHVITSIKLRKLLNSVLIIFCIKIPLVIYGESENTGITPLSYVVT